MAKTDFESVDEYIAAQPAAAQRALRAVRSTVRKAIPAADESISYQMPTYKIAGERVMYFAGWKHHYALYPATAHIVATLKNELAPYEVAKGTIRFPLALPVPVSVIAQIAKLRAKEVTARRAVMPKKTEKRRIR